MVDDRGEKNIPYTSFSRQAADTRLIMRKEALLPQVLIVGDNKKTDWVYISGM